MPPEPTPDQTYCDVGLHRNCPGYTEDESDPESCLCPCHDEILPCKPDHHCGCLTPRGKSMGGHESPIAETTTWLTPLHITDALGPFDLDPCAFPGWPTAERGISLPDDGLAVEWGGRVWLNPPYGREVWTWLDRLADHGNGTALIFARTETEGFVREVWGKADAVMFLHGRLNFHKADGSRAKANAGAPSCLVAYGRNNVAPLYESGLAGTVVEGWSR